MSDPSLHEFIDEHRREIVALCVQKMKQASPAWSETDLDTGFDGLMDEIVRALQRDAGFPVTSPLPGTSETAQRHGGYRQVRGYAIEKLATDIGSISDSVGQLAGEKGLS